MMTHKSSELSQLQKQWQGISVHMYVCVYYVYKLVARKLAQMKIMV